MKSKKINKIFLFTIFLMVIVGLAMFVSASLGILAKSADTFRAVLKSQLVLGLGLGLVGMYAALKINYGANIPFLFLLSPSLSPRPFSSPESDPIGARELSAGLPWVLFLFSRWRF